MLRRIIMGVGIDSSQARSDGFCEKCVMYSIESGNC
jgi:hypothetical protein